MIVVLSRLFRRNLIHFGTGHQKVTSQIGKNDKMNIQGINLPAWKET